MSEDMDSNSFDPGAVAAKPPRARVEDAVDESPRETMERKRDYLEGFLQKKPENLTPGEPGGALYEEVVAALKEIYDPEIPVNIYDLGLIYGIDANAETGHVHLRMTLTAPGCPVAQSFPGMVADTLREVPGVEAVEVELVWEPRWSKKMMSEAARLELGLV